jgi:hypothetical protein
MLWLVNAAVRSRVEGLRPLVLKVDSLLPRHRVALSHQKHF